MKARAPVKKQKQTASRKRDKTLGAAVADPVGKKEKGQGKKNKKKTEAPKVQVAAPPVPSRFDIPAAIRKRYFKRHGCERSGDEATAPLNAILEREAERIMGLATQQAVLDGIQGVKARHVARALAILDRPVY